MKLMIILSPFFIQIAHVREVLTMERVKPENSELKRQININISFILNGL